jgi:hypothetical protein
MSATTNVAAVATIMVFVAPTLGSAQAPHHQQRNATSSAYAAASKSSRTTQPASRSRVSQTTPHVIGPDGRDLGTDPDPMIRFQLRRDPSVPGGSGGGGM